MGIRDFFRKNKNVEIETISEVTPEESQEILFVSKAKYNRHGNKVKSELMSSVEQASANTNIFIKKIRLETRINEMDSLSYDLVTGLMYQISKKLNGEKLFVGELRVKSIGQDIEIHMSYLHGQMLESLLGRQFQTGFGLWRAYETSTHESQAINQKYISACFDKEKFRSQMEHQANEINENDVNNRKSGRRRYV